MTTKNTSADFPKEKPTIRLDDNDVPGMKDWTIDQEVTVTVKAKVKSLSRNDSSWNNDKRLWATLQIEKVTDASDGDDDNDALAEGMDSVKPTKVAKR